MTNETQTAGAAPFDAVAALAKLKDAEPSHFINVEKVFRFRKDKVLGTTRAPVTLIVPTPSFDGLVSSLDDVKIRDYVLDILNEAVFEAVRAQVSDEVAPVNKQSDLDLSKLTLEYLANVPKSDRRGGGISKETWEAFYNDYVAVMEKILKDRTKEQIANAAKLLTARFAPVKTAKPVIGKLTEYLNMWFEASENQEDLAEVYEWLTNKSAELLAIDPNAWQSAI